MEGQGRLKGFMFANVLLRRTVLGSTAVRSCSAPAQLYAARRMLSDQRLVAAVHDVGPKVRYTAHDVGGVPELLDAPLPEEKPMQPWELECHALFAILSKDGILKTDMLRRAVESLPLHAHEEWGYYERWSAAMANLLREEGHLQPGQLEAELVADDDGATEESPPRFAPGDAVLVRREELRRTAWRAPHLRTPGYIFGCHGLIERHCGAFADPSLLAFGVRPVGQQHLYRVRFRQSDLWPEQLDELDDTVDVEIYESWLEPVPAEGMHERPRETVMRHLDGAAPPHASGADCAGAPGAKHGHVHAPDDDDGHAHEHGHDHMSRTEAERVAIAAEGEPRPGERVHAALVRICLQRGLVHRERLRAVMSAIETAGVELHGARLVARAWADSAFRQRLLANGNAAALELGIVASNPNAPTELCVVASDAHVHNLIVCTLCSCYPAALLGPSPTWYKSRSYRARAVRRPRELLRNEFGLEVPANVALRVHDSTADLRYMVLPARPPGTEGWSEEQLRNLVTRDGMLGVAKV